jgi:hypothetical protein
MSTDDVLGRPSRLRQAVNRSRLLEIARSNDILVELVADRGGYLDARTVDWEDYWGPHATGLGQVGEQELRKLKQARGAYLASAFDPSHVAPYCYGYL